MSADWSTLKPSSAPALSREEILALPAWSIVVLVTCSSVREPRCETCSVDRQTPPTEMDDEVWGRAWSPDRPWASARLLTNPTSTVHLPRLPRLSFALTKEAVRSRQKTVTRRMQVPRWATPGRWFLGVDKVRQAGAQGLAVCRVVSVRTEPLSDITIEDVHLEGFPDLTEEEFVAEFSRLNGIHCDPDVARIEFRYFHPEVDR